MLLAAVGVWLAVVFALSGSGVARAADCSLDDQAYDGACGPAFELPAWGDGGGWTDPSKYTTLQLADLTGNGVDELIGRNDVGIEIWRFDTSAGQWRPAIGADGAPEVLKDFHSPLPGSSDAAGPNWTQPQYYSTIQTADLNGDGAHEIIARFPDGMRVYKYTPPAGTKNINGGTWSMISSKGPNDDGPGNEWTNPALYLGIHVLSANPQNHTPAYLVDNGGAVWQWTGTGWSGNVPQADGIPFSRDEPYYLNLAPVPNLVGDNSPSIMYLSSNGLSGQRLSGGQWKSIGSPQFNPFSAATGFPTSPSYYTTIRYANVDSAPGVDVLGRLSGGLYMYRLSSDGATWTSAGPTLSDLKGSSTDLQNTPGRWASIRTGDILGNGRDQVLALDGTALQAWSYDPTAKSWTKLPAAQALNLGGDMWDKNASYYSTIGVGDVTGDHHDAVIARGPYGIRTWFYCAAGDTRAVPCGNLNGKSGWTSWLLQDTGSYPQFAGGQAQAFTALTDHAKTAGLIPTSDGSVRDVWTRENAAARPALDALQQGILAFAGCSGPTNGGPPYASCTPPAGSSGFTAPEWTAVVNEIFAEIDLARHVDDFFDTMRQVSQNIFVANGAALDAIAAKLGLQGATGITTEVSPAEIIGTICEILGAIAAGADLPPPVWVALDVAGILMTIQTDTSGTANSKFSVTYADLKDKFATMVDEIDKARDVQSQQIRQSYQLMQLINQLTTGSGPWANPDTIGLESANEQGFALWTYQQLLPTLYVRYVIRGGCVSDPYHFLDACDVPGKGPETIGAPPAFTTIGAPPYGTVYGAAFPCQGLPPPPPDTDNSWFCHFTPLPADISTRVWGPLSDTCNYKPGNAATKWTYGTCNLGIDKSVSVALGAGDANGWHFTSYCGNPVINSYRAFEDFCSGAGGRASVGQRGQVKLRGAIRLPKGFQVKNAAIPANGLLYDTAGPHPPKPLGRPRIGATPGLTLRVIHTSARRARAAVETRARSGATLTLARSAHRRLTFRLAVRNVHVALPAACHALAPSDSLSTPPVHLTTTILLTDRAKTIPARLAGLWRCVRDRTGTITRLLPVPPPRLSQRPGLAVSVSGPHSVASGHRTTYLIRVSYRRRGPRNRFASSLWHVLVYGSLRARAGAANRSLGPTARVTKLRQGRSRTFRVTVTIPRAAHGRACFGVAASADAARPAAARTCARVRVQVRPPPGLG